MNGRRAIVGLCMLCALLASAFAAQSASAITGTTAVTCKAGAGDTGGATFNEAHCKPSSPSGSFGHYKISQSTTTELALTTAIGTFKIKATLGGVATTLTATELEGTGLMENRVAENGEHNWLSFGLLILRNVLPSPFGNCFVYTDDGTGTPGEKGVIDTEELRTTTEGQGMGLKMEPVNEAKILARFWILDKNKKGAGGECAIQGTYNITGSVVATPDGATATITHTGTTEQNTLKMGQGEATIKAGIEGSLTLEGRAVGTGGAYTPIGFTTYST